MRAAVGEIVLRLAVPRFATILSDLHQDTVPGQRRVGRAGEQSLEGVGDVLLLGVVANIESIDYSGFRPRVGTPSIAAASEKPRHNGFTERPHPPAGKRLPSSPIRAPKWVDLQFVRETSAV